MTTAFNRVTLANSKRAQRKGVPLQLVRRFLALAVFLVAIPAAFGQSTSDVVPRHRLVPRREQVRRDLDASRRLGPLRIQPRLIFRDLGYNNNVFGTPDDPVSDWTATVAAGAHWTLPFGPKMFVQGDVLPEYTYYDQLSERRFFGGTYNASALALFNRLSLEAGVGTNRSLGLVSSETEAAAVRRINDVVLAGEIDLLRRFSVFGRATSERHRFRSEEITRGDLARVTDLDRDDAAVLAGVRYRFSSSLDFAVGAERTRSEFRLRPDERDNESEALLLTVQYNRPRAYINLTVASRAGKPLAGSTFPPYDSITGSYFASWALTAPVEVQAHGSRRVVYALFADNPYFIETRNGLTVVLRPGNRFAIRAMGEFGDNDYERAVRAGLRRSDAVRTYGGGISFRVYRDVGLTIAASQSEFDSTLDDYDRSVLRVQSLITIGEFSR